MRFFRFDAEVRRMIERFGSRKVGVSRIVRSEGLFQAGCMHFDPGGVIGFHPAGVNQLFLVVSGSGWVRDETSGRVPIRAGEAVFWEAGEGHESGTETGMTAIVIEGPGLNPDEWMPPLKGR
jgi:quercetin dioxygenase-like cupin family protein